MQGTRPRELPPASKTAAAGRSCAFPGCSTKLSAYNHEDHCWQHLEVNFPNFRGKRLERRARTSSSGVSQK